MTNDKWIELEQERDEELKSAWNKIGDFPFASDGVVCADKFFDKDQPIRYVFILKEVNALVLNQKDTKLKNGGLRYFLSIGAATANNGNGGHTWGPACKWLGISDKSYGKGEESERAKILSWIAAVNLKKIDTGESKTSMSEIEKHYRENDCIRTSFANQLNDIISMGNGPVVIVCCGSGVYDVVKDYVLQGKLQNFMTFQKDGYRMFSYAKLKDKDDCWVLDFYHPNARKGGLAELFKEYVRKLVAG